MNREGDHSSADERVRCTGCPRPDPIENRPNTCTWHVPDTPTALTEENWMSTKSDRPPLPLGWKVFCLVALAVALGHIALTVAALAGGA